MLGGSLNCDLRGGGSAKELMSDAGVSCTIMRGGTSKESFATARHRAVGISSRRVEGEILAALPPQSLLGEIGVGSLLDLVQDLFDMRPGIRLISQCSRAHWRSLLWPGDSTKQQNRQNQGYVFLLDINPSKGCKACLVVEDLNDTKASLAKKLKLVRRERHKIVRNRSL